MEYWSAKKRKTHHNEQEEIELGAQSLLSLLNPVASGEGKDNIVSSGNHIYLYSEIDRKTSYEVNNFKKYIE